MADKPLNPIRDLEINCPVIKIVDKPLILRQLESSCESCLTDCQKVSAIELIVFIFNVLKNKVKYDSEPICVKQLYVLVKQYMFKQLSAISELNNNQMMSTCGQPMDKQKLSFNNLLTHFIEDKILSINVNKQTIGFSNDITSDSCHCCQWLSEVEQMLDNCLVCILQKYLMSHLKQLGLKRVDDIEMGLIRSHNYLFEYLFCRQNDYRLVDFIQSFPEEFKINYLHNNRQMEAMVESSDVQSVSVETKTYFYSQTDDILNKTMGSLIGSVHLLDSNNGFIRLLEENIEFKSNLEFKIDSKVIQIYGQEVIGEEIIQWIHSNDLVVFDAKLVAKNHIESDCNHNNGYLYRNCCHFWSVTSISRIQHFGKCYICAEHLFSNCNWNH